jgi:hypothetical protein
MVAGGESGGYRQPVKLLEFYLLAVVVSVIVSLGGFAWVGETSSVVSAAALTFGVLAGLVPLLWRKSQPIGPQPRKPLTLGELIVVLAAVVFVARTALRLGWMAEGELRVGSPHNLGDFALHLAHLNFLRSGVSFPWVNPIAAGMNWTYPPGVAVWTLAWASWGWEALPAMAWTSLLGLSAGLYAVWRWQGGGGLAVLLFNGGLLGWTLLGGGNWVEQQATLAWKDLAHTLLVTQRGFLFGLAGGAYCLLCWRELIFRGKEGRGWIALIVYCVMPLFHLHTFIFLSLLLGFWFLLGWQRRRLLLWVALALLPATCGVWFSTGGFAGSAGLAVDLSWWRLERAVWKALVIDFGFWIPLGLGLSGWLILRERSRLMLSALRRSETFAWLAPSLLILIVLFFVRLHPWGWDNTKLLFWCWLVSAPLLLRAALFRLPQFLRFVLVILLFGGGFLSFWSGIEEGRGRGYGLVQLREFHELSGLRQIVGPDDTIAIAPEYNHPLLLLGHPLAMGWGPHLWSHGLPSQEFEEKVRRLMHREDGWESVAAELGVNYLLLGSRERQKFPLAGHRWQREGEVVFQVGTTRLVRMKLPGELNEKE